MSESKLVQAGNYANAVTANVAKNSLATHGIESEVFNDQIDSYYTTAVGGIRLMVNSADLEAAKEILAAEDPVDDEVVKEEDEIGGGDAYCSACHSKKIESKSLEGSTGKNPVTNLFQAILGIKSEYRCLDCGNTWKSGAAGESA